MIHNYNVIYLTAKNKTKIIQSFKKDWYKKVTYQGKQHFVEEKSAVPPRIRNILRIPIHTRTRLQRAHRCLLTMLSESTLFVHFRSGNFAQE